jgi:hypothetical protein
MGTEEAIMKNTFVSHNSDGVAGDAASLDRRGKGNSCLMRYQLSSPTKSFYGSSTNSSQDVNCQVGRV